MTRPYNRSVWLSAEQGATRAIGDFDGMPIGEAMRSVGLDPRRPLSQVTKEHDPSIEAAALVDGASWWILT